MTALLIDLDTGRPVVTTPTQDRNPAPGCAPWCDADCDDWTDEDGNTRHAGSYTDVPCVSAAALNRKPATVAAGLNRYDPAGDTGDVEIHLIAERENECGQDVYLTPSQARKLGRSLIDLADKANEAAPTITLPGYCPRCGRDRPIRGRRVVSTTGVVRVRNGRCLACNRPKLVAVERTAANQAAGARAVAA